MNERMEFLVRLRQGERMSDLCREYGISRKTGYKFKKRFEAMGLAGLEDQSRARKRQGHRTSEAVRRLFIEARRAHPTWGPRKLRVLVARHEPGVRLPALSTIWRLLKDAGLVQGRKRRRRMPPHLSPLRHARQPNDVWCVDFKGQFRLGNTAYCYPLTVTDAHSRYIIGCDALENTRCAPARPVFVRLFEEFGLPVAIRSDNGAPFATCGVAGLSALSAWWTALGIEHERIRPGNPQENGRHERMHRTLKRETTRPPAYSQLGQQERFDAWREEFNEERPHEALGDATPASLYTRSARQYRRGHLHLDYPLADVVSRVSSAGHIRPPKATGVGQVYVGVALAGLPLGLRELDDGSWLVLLRGRQLGRCVPGKTRLQDLPQQLVVE